MTAGLFLTLWSRGQPARPEPPEGRLPDLPRACCCVVALALLFSTLTSSAMAAVGTVGVVLAGRYSDVIRNMRQVAPGRPRLVDRRSTTLFPTSANFDFKDRVAYGDPVAAVRPGLGHALCAALHGHRAAPGRLVLRAGATFSEGARARPGLAAPRRRHRLRPSVPMDGRARGDSGPRKRCSTCGPGEQVKRLVPGFREPGRRPLLAAHRPVLRRAARCSRRRSASSCSARSPRSRPPSIRGWRSPTGTGPPSSPSPSRSGAGRPQEASRAPRARRGEPPRVLAAAAGPGVLHLHLPEGPRAGGPRSSSRRATIPGRGLLAQDPGRRDPH